MPERPVPLLLKSTFEMPIGTTVMGVPFECSTSLATGLVVSFTSSTLRITPETIKIIRHELVDIEPRVLKASLR